MIQGAHRAAVLSRPGRFDLVERETPEPGAGQIVLSLEGCGVCGSNVPPWRGLDGFPYPAEPGAPGHEGWGTVAAVGPGVATLAPGDRVTALTYNAFAEIDLARVDDVVRLPEELDGQPVPGEPLACAVNVFRRCQVRPGDVVVVLGIGFLGSLLLQLVETASPGHLIAVSRRRTALDAAAELGADEVLRYDEVAARVSELTGGRGADVVIEATGEQRPLDLGGELTRVRGRLVLAGYHQGGPRMIDLQLWNWRGLDVINAHERAPEVYLQGMRDGVARLAAGELVLAPLVTHRFPLRDIDRGFQVAAERPSGFLKAIIELEPPA